METIRKSTFSGANGLKLAADVGGDPSAPPVILMHGGGQTRHSWGTALKALVAEGFYVINLDARGHGDSEWSPEGECMLPQLGADLRAVIGTLSRPPALVGASMGGATGLYLVGNSPEPVARALVLVDIVPRIEVDGSRKIANFMRSAPNGFANLDEAAEAVAAYNPHRPRPKDPSGLMKNLRRRADGRLYWHWDPAFVNRPVAAEPPQFLESLIAACRNVTIPTMLVRGLKSDIVSDAGVADLKRLVPHSEVFDVPEAGHMVAGDRNDAFNEAVIGFLRRHP
ncbi:MAG TPA: alpha/beta hydrolase [Nevskiaceae bacterium]|nr:alpha/beta hydrolase [Nevskiaceae bacterium]